MDTSTKQMLSAEDWIAKVEELLRRRWEEADKRPVVDWASMTNIRQNKN